MIRLSRKGWNNVIIISVSLMIIILNVMNKNSMGDDDSDVSGEAIRLLESGSVILTLDYPAAKLERIGKSWRSVGKPLAIDRVEALEQAWLSLEVLEIAGASVNLAPEAVVRIAVMGFPEPLTVAWVNSTGFEYLVVNNRVFELPSAQVDKLFPSELITVE